MKRRTTVSTIREPLRRVEIKFYKTSDQYGAFSNFALGCPIEIEGTTWPTSEHYYQAQKMLDPKDQETIRKTVRPAAAAKLGRDRSKKIRTDWEAAKLGVMRQCLEAKFTQHQGLGSLLMGTRGANLVEHTANDRFWGDGGDGTGENWLGRLLVELRDQMLLDRARTTVK